MNKCDRFDFRKKMQSVTSRFGRSILGDDMNFKVLNVKEDFDAIRRIWTEANFVDNSSYFLSWGWIENWLTSLPADIPLQLAVAFEKDVPLFAFFIGKNKVVRKKIFKSQALFLNATGFKEYDFPLWIEYNSIRRSTQTRVSLTDIVTLLPDGWDEMFLPGLDGESFPGNCLDQVDSSSQVRTNDPLYGLLVESDLPSYYINLNLVREKHGDYVSLLNSNTRSQIRRSYRGYETKGQIDLEEAGSIEGAMEIFNEMFELHRNAYKRMNRRSNFTTKYSEEFHTRLIKKRFHEGELQLLRITCGNEAIGCLYNFVYKGRVFFYQSGLNFHSDKRLKPGLICHTEAIKHNADLNHLCYDFLAGDERYKASLATHKRRLIWARIQKPRLTLKLEPMLERLLRKLGIL